MTTVRYEARAHRLRIDRLPTSSLSAIQDALATFAQFADGHLIIDLTAVNAIEQDVADDLVAAAQGSRREGGTVAFIRKHGTLVDEALTAAEQASRE